MLQNISTGHNSSNNNNNNNNNNNSNNNILYANTFEKKLCSEALRGITTQEGSRMQRIESVLLLH
jgi:hypothetical protein